MPPAFDATWRAMALNGDEDAVRLLASSVIRPLYRFCFYRVGQNAHLCEDVVQETLTRALRDLHKYEPERAGNRIFPWLTGLARNEIHRVLARRGKTVSLEALWERMDRELLDLYAHLDSEVFPDEIVQREETREMVNATMSQLPPHYREALEAKYCEGGSVRDIAGKLNTTEKAVESLLARARKAFQATFIALARNMDVELML